MQLTGREFRADQPLQSDSYAPKSVNASTTDEVSVASDFRHHPRSTIQAFLILTGAETTGALLAPVLAAACLGWWAGGEFSWLGLILSMLAMLAAGWGMSALWSFYDYCYSQRPAARWMPDPLGTGFGLIQSGVLAPRTVRDIGRILVSVALLCVLGLVVLFGWPILFFSVLSFLLLWAVIALPLRYGNRGWGFSELAIFLGMGFLPALISYYVQTGTISWLPVWAGGSFGLFSLLTFFNFNAVQFRRDWLIHKRTLVVNLGLLRAMDISATLMVLAFVLQLLMITLTDLPLLALAGLGGLPVGLGMFARLNRGQLTPEVFMRVYRTSVHAAVISVALFCAALLLVGLV